MSWGTTDTSTTVLGANQFPVSAVAEPGRTNLTALEGGPGSVDVNSNRTAPMSAYIKDGGDVTQGTSTDANTVASVMGRLTKIRDLLNATLTVAVSGSVTEANSASIKADLDAINTAIGAVSDAAWSGSGNGSEIAILKKIVAELAGTIAVSGTFWQATQPVSAASLPLPTGAATAAKQPALGTAGTASSDVISVQGIASMTALKVDGSGVTQPVSGTVTANAGANLNTSLLALESGGNLATLAGAITGAKVQENVAQINGVAPSMGNGVSGTGVQRVTLASDSTGQVALAAGSNAIGGVTQSGTWTVQPGNTPNSTPWLVQAQVGTAGGSTPYHNVVSSGTNGTNVKASAGQVYDGSISNTSASAVYFRFYDTSGAPTVGTTTTKRTIQVPGNGTVIFSWPNGLKFTSGIAWGITTAIADADTTAIGSAVSIDFGYN